MSILRSENIHKSYTETQDRVDVLKGINLEVSEGETLAIIGPSGAGKSTLLHIIGCIEPPTSGEIKIHDENVANNGGILCDMVSVDNYSCDGPSGIVQ